jgi:hypothetical protein
MLARINLFSWRRKSSWFASILNLSFILLALVIVPITAWLGLPILVWAYLRMLPRWTPNWLQWSVVVLLSAHAALINGWLWGAALVLCATTVAARYLESGEIALWFKLFAEWSLAVIWIGLSFLLTGSYVTVGLNSMIGFAVILWQSYGQDVE